ncbi:MAG: glycosyltransferase, partial [Chloroflexota bacterium]
MKIVITSHGTRGDVQPYLALAVGLQQAGHQVTLATSANYAEWIQSHGVQAHPTQFNVQEFTLRPETQAALKSGNPVRIFGKMRQLMQQGAAAMDEVWAAIQTADFVIDSPTSTGALDAAQTRGLPVALAYPVPFAPTRAFPSFFLGQPRFSLGAGYNRLTHMLMHQMLWSGMSGPLSNTLRKKLGQKPWGSFANQLAYAKQMGIPSLYGFSAHVLPKPADWDEHQHVTGYWFLEAQPDWRPPTDLASFLEGGPPPIYVGFGSMSHENPERQTHLALRALELSGQRGVLLTGWGGLTRQATPPNVFFVDNVPHDWLFPRMAAVVHHGGAGTTAAGLRAGVPN